MSKDTENTVVMHGREFVLSEPSTSVVIRILNVIGSLGVRAGKASGPFTGDAEFTGEGMISALLSGAVSVAFGLLAVLSEHDLLKLGSAVLQFEDDGKGRKWLQEEGLQVTPLIEAFFINLRLSDDLIQAVQAFLAGIEGLSGIVELFAPETEESEESADDSAG